MSAERFTHRGERCPKSPDQRTDFQRDWDRIVFSTAFRRLHDKTQVFPLPDDDVVHSRLTHSIEVAAVGRSLGTIVGAKVVEKHSLTTLRASDFGDVVAAACLAHDIGNPPLGHAGEDAIARFFRTRLDASQGRTPQLGGDPVRSEQDVRMLATLTERQRDELRRFEGNAQGFRILTRLQLESTGGLSLTCATLGAFMKYPREAGDDLTPLAGAASKKYGLFQEEMRLAEVLATELGLVPYRSQNGGRGWCRHPLAYVVEAADDICNSILDLEDGVRLKHLPLDSVLITPLETMAKLSGLYAKEKYEASKENHQKLSYLRALAIKALVTQCAAAFDRHEADILSGTPVRPLIKDIASFPQVDTLGTLARTTCYQAPDVLQLELAGYDALGGLLDRFVSAVISGASPTDQTREGRILQLLERRALYVHAEPSLSSKLLRITDYLSGMTDRYAMSTYRHVAGIDIPGRIP